MKKSLLSAILIAIFAAPIILTPNIGDAAPSKKKEDIRQSRSASDMDRTHTKEDKRGDRTHNKEDKRGDRTHNKEDKRDDRTHNNELFDFEKNSMAAKQREYYRENRPNREAFWIEQNRDYPSSYDSDPTSFYDDDPSADELAAAIAAILNADDAPTAPVEVPADHAADAPTAPVEVPADYAGAAPVSVQPSQHPNQFLLQYLADHGYDANNVFEANFNGAKAYEYDLKYGKGTFYRASRSWAVPRDGDPDSVYKTQPDFVVKTPDDLLTKYHFTPSRDTVYDGTFLYRFDPAAGTFTEVQTVEDFMIVYEYGDDIRFLHRTMTNSHPNKYYVVFENAIYEREDNEQLGYMNWPETQYDLEKLSKILKKEKKKSAK